MFFSKSFGYSIRAILYLASDCPGKKWVQLNEIAEFLQIPQPFLGKLMINLVKEGVLDSRKGPAGGFCINNDTMGMTLSRILAITGEQIGLDTCVLRLRECNSANPCPLHFKARQFRDNWVVFLSSTTLGDLTGKENEGLVKHLYHPEDEING
ncbi:MAG: RrF2 family transcriptional regulator [Chitinophagaceae bacterium]